MNGAARARHLFAPALLLAALLLPAPAAAKAPQKKSPHVQVTGTATVASHPKKVMHANGRDFLEFWIRFREAVKQPDASAGDDPAITIVTNRDVKVFHDLTCGGAPVEARRGDLVEIRGEYVHPDDGRDLVHFTHPATGACGRPGSHPGGYIRLPR